MASMGLGQINTTRFLFDEDDAERHGGKTDANATTSPKVKSYLQMNATDDNFPILVRHEEYPNMVSLKPVRLQPVAPPELLIGRASCPHRPPPWISLSRNLRDQNRSRMGGLHSADTDLSTVCP